MNAVQLYNYIGKLASSISIVKSYYNESVYECWNTNEVRYGSFVFNIKEINTQQNITSFNCIAYFGDRLLDDKSNCTSIQTDAVNVIQSVLGAIKQSDGNIDVTYPVNCVLFEQDFADCLAGAYANFTIISEGAGECGFDGDVFPVFPEFSGGENVLDNYYTKSESDDKYQPKGNYLTSIPAEYVTESELETRLEDIEIGDVDLTDYYTKSESDNKYQPKGNYLTSIPSEYVTESELETRLEDIEIGDVDLTDYYTKSESDDKYQPKGNYLTSIPSEYVTESELETRLENVDVDLTNYYTKEEVDAKFAAIDQILNQLIYGETGVDLSGLEDQLEGILNDV